MGILGVRGPNPRDVMHSKIQCIGTTEEGQLHRTKPVGLFIHIKEGKRRPLQEPKHSP